MRFWDSSALVPLLVEQAYTARLQKLYDEDPQLGVWWAAEVECVSAVTRLLRDGGLTADAASTAFDRLRRLRSTWHEVQPVEELREVAVRLLRVHDLRAADALQLAAAFIGAERRPASLSLVCVDRRLVEAAEREGFSVVDFRRRRSG